jgi:conjugative relaxase-like TrwC/TraI family protein
MSIAKLSGGTANARYYLERDADCHASDYYTDERESAGRWCGHGAARLGLDGPIGTEQAAVFASLLNGVLPDGTVAARPVWRRNPKDPDGPRIDIRQSGLDLVVSPPKSVSVLYALADPAVAAKIVAIHEHAVAEALGYLERHAGHGLRGHQGGSQRAERMDTEGLVAAAFTHHTSRSDDPQLHTHLVIANLVHGRDGKWSALDSRAFYYQARTAGCIYQAVLRGELTRTLGVGWGPVRRGVAEITGIPTALRKAFSSRREAIETELDRTGGSGRRAAQRAAYVTRPAKSHTPQQSLRESWSTRGRAQGCDSAAVVSNVVGRMESPAMTEDGPLARELFGPDGLTEHATSFDRRDAIQALTETVPAGVAVTGEQLEALADRLLTDGDEAVPLLQPALAGRDRRWSTRTLIAAEQWAMAAVQKQSTIVPLPAKEAHQVVSLPRLSSEQQVVVAGLLASPDLIDVVVGPAGSGKTAALHAAADHWTGAGVPVIGCALAAVTARRLESATKVSSMSLARLLTDVERVDPATGQPVGLAPQTVVLCDEASMIGTRQFSRLTRHVDAVGGKLVLVGDPEQLAEIDAGGIFAALVRTAEPLSLTGNQRQIATWETAALSRLRDGQIDVALDSYIAHGRIHVGTNDSDVRTLLAGEYREHQLAGTDVVALATSRRDVERLNRTIRGGLRDAGELGPDVVTISTDDGDRSYGIGDKVIVTRNDHRVGLLNGTRVVLTAATAGELTLTPDGAGAVVVPVSWAADHLNHGYAMTVHKAQGLTTGVALLYGSAALCQQAGYVAMSRGAEANHLYTSASALTGDRAGIEIDVPSFQLMTGPDPADVLDRLRERLAVSHRHVLASDQTPAYRQEPHAHREHEHARGHGRSR